MTKLNNLQIIRVLETPLGSNYGAYADDSEVEAARKKISARYNELKGPLDFDLASLSARVEWLQEQRPQDFPSATHLSNPYRPSESLCGPIIFKFFLGSRVPILNLLDYQLKAGQVWCSECAKRSYVGLITARRQAGEQLNSQQELDQILAQIEAKFANK